MTGGQFLRSQWIKPHQTACISKAWVRHRIEEVIGQLSTVLDDEQIEDMVQAFTRKGLI